MAILTYPLNGITYDAEDAETYFCTRTSGVYSADDNFQASVTGSREVTISPGIAWIRNAEYHGKVVYNPEPFAVNVPIADGATSRIDRIVLRFDKQANETTIELLQGENSNSPTAPAITQTEELYELGLCTVSVNASAVSLSDGDVTSTLLNESVCGVMRDGVTTIPTEQLQAEVEDLLTKLRNEISDAENGTYVTVGEYRGLTEITLAADDWPSSSPYQQVISMSGVTEDTVFDVGILYPNSSRTNQKAINKAAGYLYNIVTGSGTITFSATERPTTDIPLGLRGVI